MDDREPVVIRGYERLAPLAGVLLVGPALLLGALAWISLR